MLGVEFITTYNGAEYPRLTNVDFGNVMGVTLTSRPLGKSGRAPMCGVPHHAWQAYVGKLLRAGHKVVICDQIEAASKNKIVRRDVTRVLTPGTVVEDAVNRVMKAG